MTCLAWTLAFSLSFCVKIEALDGLDMCVRIKFLYAQNNRIRCGHFFSAACDVVATRHQLISNFS